MSRKKVSLIVAAGVLVTSLVGGSLAWFTSSDEVINNFTTGSIEHNIVEDFDSEETGAAKDFLPGDEVNKDVWIKNTGKSDALLRVKIQPEWKNNVENKLENDMIELVFSSSVDLDPSNGIDEKATWVKGNDDYLYYVKVFEKGTQTELLLDAVKLKGEANNDYAGKEMQVVVSSETVQVNKDAYRTEWSIEENSTSTPEEEIINKLDKLVDDYKVNNNKTHN